MECRECDKYVDECRQMFAGLEDLRTLAEHTEFDQANSETFHKGFFELIYKYCGKRKT